MGRPTAEAEVSFWPFLPDREEWRRGERTIVCLAIESFSGRTITGSVRE